MPTLLDTLKHKSYIGVLGQLIKFAVVAPPMSYVGAGGTRKLCEHISRMGFRKILIVTDKPLVELGIVARATEVLAEENREFVIYDGVLPDPTLDLVEACVAMIGEQQCDSVLAIGGGSSIDTAKVAAAAATNGGDARAMIGFFKAKVAPLPLFVIPTTSGTGSEVTFGAVISDPVTHLKNIVGDTKLTPKAIALDPELLAGMPPAITAATGMDALTHAVEAFVSPWRRPHSDAYAKSAIKMIFENLPVCHAEGGNLRAREQMAIAAFYAGMAINAAGCGNVHAIAHQLGGWYGTPHGLANAVVMPQVLKFSKAEIVPRLAELADLLELGQRHDPPATKADHFIQAIEQLNQALGIGPKLEAIKAQDIQAIAIKATSEGAGYPVPRLMDQQQCEDMIRALCV